jgi:hypothetical protein
MAMILIDSYCRVGPSVTAVTDGAIGAKIRKAQSPLFRKGVRLYITRLTGVNNIFGRCRDQWRRGTASCKEKRGCSWGEKMVSPRRMQLFLERIDDLLEGEVEER